MKGLYEGETEMYYSSKFIVKKLSFDKVILRENNLIIKKKLKIENKINERRIEWLKKYNINFLMETLNFNEFINYNTEFLNFTYLKE